MVEIISFAQAVALPPDTIKRHLLLGNGFSRALREDIFSYDALFTSADFGALSQTARQAFAVLGTTDFEVVMRALHDSAELVTLYEPTNTDLSTRLRSDAVGLREVLVRAIASNHPENPTQVSAAAYAACRTFLANFTSIYTFNYDLLLYWTLMHEEVGPPIKFDDGFRTPDEGSLDYVTWEVEKSDKQNIFYLHGALHLFDAGTELQKYTWVNTGIPLIEQVRDALERGFYPLFVAESESAAKLHKIKHNGFLFRAYRSFSKIGHSLYVHGHSMSPNDEHIVRLIERNSVKYLFVGLHGSPQSDSNQRIIERAGAIGRRRPERRPLEIHFYDAESARVWG